MNKFRIPVRKAWLLAPFALMFCFNAPENDEDKMRTIMVSVKNTLSFLHFNAVPINDAYSVQVFDKYMESLDPEKRIFLKSDIQEFRKHQKLLDDYLNNGDLTFFNLSLKRMFQRQAEIDKMTQEILSKPMDLSEDEVYTLDEKKKDYPVDAREQYQEWKKFVKYQVLANMESLKMKEETQKEKKDSVQKFKLKDTINLNILTIEQKKNKSVEEIRDLIKNFNRRIQKRKVMDWFSVYMNAYTEIFDPHTNYFSPKMKDDFDTMFSGKIIGIGALISEKKGNLYIENLVVGGPAWNSKQISDGDKILKVKPAPDKDVVNVVGMLNDEVVRLIRGQKDTEVILTLQKKDGSVKEVKIIRKEVEMEDTFAKSIVMNATDGKKYGYVYLPSFNANFNDPKGRNASDDVKAEILKLKRQNVKGIVLDVRSNGGGSLTEVVEMLGHFIPGGPAVQIRESSGKSQVQSMPRGYQPIWNGPLVVMQNERSASASEILTGALKDYRRAIILGSPSSFGKGSVQTFVELNRFMNSSEDFGALKMTIQKFYRVNGMSTQLKGVESDVVMKDWFSYMEDGERYQKTALPWDEIQPVNYTPMPNVDYTDIIAKGNARVATNATYQLLNESAIFRGKMIKEESIPLELNKFMALMKKRADETKKFKALDKFRNNLKFFHYTTDMQRRKTDEAYRKKTDAWVKSMEKDVYLQEAVNILGDMQK